MSRERAGAVLLALDAGVRETGWAVFHGRDIQATGTIKLAARGGIDSQIRVDHLVRCLDDLVARWAPDAVACCQPTGIGWRVPALELLDRALAHWSRRCRLYLHPYTVQEVRAAAAGHPNASREDLGYAVMLRRGLIGHRKTTQEWEAIAVGDYHLDQRFTGRGPSPGTPQSRPGE